jgi:hypothetical protein
MLAVSDNERDAWQQLVEDTEGRLAVMLTTPTHLMVATDLERVLNSALLPTAAAAAAEGGEVALLSSAGGADDSNAQQQLEDVQQAGVQQAQGGQDQQQQQQGGDAQGVAAGAGASEMNGRFIHIDA